MLGPTMEIEIATIGGYEEVGRQMTAVRAGNDVVIFDMGLNLSQVLIHDNVETEQMHSLDLIDMGAIPDDRVMSDLEGDVQAIVPTHGHLDHIGAISKLAHRYDAPVVATTSGQPSPSWYPFLASGRVGQVSFPSGMPSPS